MPTRARYQRVVSVRASGSGSAASVAASMEVVVGVIVLALGCASVSKSRGGKEEEGVPEVECGDGEVEDVEEEDE